MSDKKERPPDGWVLPAIAMAVVLAVLLGGWLLFPRVQAYLGRQDCIATGRTNCG